MKGSIVIIICVLSYLTIWVQPVDTIALAANKKAIMVDKDLKKIDSIKKIVDKKETVLTQRLDDASKTIDYLNSLINSFGQIFTILGIFIGIIALALPVVMYQFGIKPSQRALKELESNFDTRLSSYLKNARDNEIDKAINNIQNGSPEKKNQAIAYLTLSYHEGLTDQQLFRIYAILNRNLNQSNIKSQLAFILTTSKNEYAEHLFGNEESIRDPIIKQMAYLYFTKTGFTNHRENIASIINTAENPVEEFITFVINLAQYSYSEVIELFNDENLIDLLNIGSSSTIRSTFANILPNINISEQVFNGSYLYRKIQDVGTAAS